MNLVTVESLITPIILIVTALGAWRVQLNILARRTAFNYITEIELDPVFRSSVSATKTYLIKGNKKKDWTNFAERWATNKLSKKEILSLNDVFIWLNNRENLSIALIKGTMHLPTYVEWWGSELIREWKGAEPFVLALRAKKRSGGILFANFERIATSAKYEKKLLRSHRKHVKRIRKKINLVV